MLLDENLFKEEKVSNQNKGWTHFTYKSGANPYVAKTSLEKNRILKKYRNSTRKTGDSSYEIDDTKKNKDLFSVNEDASAKAYGKKLGSEDIQYYSLMNRFNYTIKQVRIDNNNKTYEIGSFKIPHRTNSTHNGAEFKRFIDSLKEKGYTEVKNSKDSLSESTEKDALDNYVKYLNKMIEQEKDALANAKSEWVKATIEKRLNAFKQDLKDATSKSSLKESNVIGGNSVNHSDGNRVAYSIVVFSDKNKPGETILTATPKNAFDYLYFDTAEQAQEYADKNYPDAEYVMIREDSWFDSRGYAGVSGPYLERTNGNWDKHSNLTVSENLTEGKTRFSEIDTDLSQEIFNVVLPKKVIADDLVSFMYQFNDGLKAGMNKMELLVALKDARTPDEFGKYIYNNCDPDKYRKIYNESKKLKESFDDLDDWSRMPYAVYMVDSDDKIVGESLTRQEAKKLTEDLKNTFQDYIYVTRVEHYERHGRQEKDYQDVVDVYKKDGKIIVNLDRFHIFNVNDSLKLDESNVIGGEVEYIETYNNCKIYKLSSGEFSASVSDPKLGSRNVDGESVEEVRKKIDKADKDYRQHFYNLPETLVKESFEDEHGIESIGGEQPQVEIPAQDPNNQDNGLVALVNSLIQDEFDAIQQYKDAITNFAANNKTELTTVLQDILDEENIHVGQLETLLKSLDSSAESIEQGKQEAEEQINLQITESLKNVNGYTEYTIKYKDGSTETVADIDENGEPNFDITDEYILDTYSDNATSIIKKVYDENNVLDEKETIFPIDTVTEDLDKKEETKKCSICGKEFIGYGNNARPINDGVCCDDCNMSEVIPARLKQIVKGDK